MSTRNPFTPPNAAVTDVQPVQSKMPQYVIAALIAIQLLATIRYAGAYFELVRVGAAHPAALLFGAPASLCLYIAAIVMVFGGSRGRRLFLFGAVGLALSVPFWGGPYLWTVVAGCGAALGAGGWWVTGRARRSEIPVESGAG
jgi:hypothetical protein